MSDLKPCPFCGSHGFILYPNCTKDTPYDPRDRAYPLVRCAECHCEVTGDNWDKSGKTAIANWNNRTIKSGDTIETAEGLCMVVPIEPTEVMTEAGKEAHSEGGCCGLTDYETKENAIDIYWAMIQAVKGSTK